MGKLRSVRLVQTNLNTSIHLSIHHPSINPSIHPHSPTHSLHMGTINILLLEIQQTWYLFVELNGISQTLGYRSRYGSIGPTSSSKHLRRADSDASPLHTLEGENHNIRMNFGIMHNFRAQSQVVCK